MTDQSTPTISERIDKILGIKMKDYGTKTLKLIDVNEARTQLLSLMADFAERITPEKMELVEYKHRGLMDLTETSLSEATHNLQAHAHNTCVDTITQNVKAELGAAPNQPNIPSGEKVKDEYK